MKTADAIVIGAGINGAATAYNLVKRGLKRVVLIDRHLTASGGTGKSAAIVRQHYSTEMLCRIVKRSVEIFSNFNEIVGGDPGYTGCGWAFLVPESLSDGFKRNLAMQQALGIDTREITRDELKAIEPRMEGLGNARHIAHERQSGYADPRTSTCAYVQRFVDLGGDLMTMTPVTGLIMENGAIKGVRTASGDVSSNVVVNAAGPWSHHLAQWAGIDLPIEVMREQEVVLETRIPGGPIRTAISDAAQCVYYRPGGGSRLLFGRGFPKEYQQVDPNHYDQDADNSFIIEAQARLFGRLPSIKNAIHFHAFASLYDVTPDWHPILGKDERVKGYYHCSGFSGHGFKIGPGIGELMAEEIVDGKAHSVNIDPLRFSRFAAGKLVQAAYGGNRA